MLNLYTIFATIAVITCLYTIFLVNIRAYRSQITIWFTFFLLCGFIVDGSGLVHIFNPNNAVIYFIEILRITALCFLPISFLIFALNYAGRDNLLKNFIFNVPFSVFIIIMTYLLWATDHIYVHDLSQAVSYPWGYQFAFGRYSFLLGIWIAAGFFHSCLSLFLSMRASSNPLQKKQLRTILFAALLPLISGAVVFGIINPANNLIVLQLLTDTIVYLIVGFSLIRYRLFTFDETSVSREIFYNIHGAYFLVDSNYQFILSNKFFETLTGYSGKEIVGQNMQILFPDIESFQVFESKVISVINAKDHSESEETEIRHKNGIAVPISIVGSTYFDSHKNPIGILFVANDIKKFKEKTLGLEIKSEEILNQNIELEKTKKAMINLLEDLTEAKNKVEEEKTKDEAMLESIGDGLIIVDPHGRIIKINHAAEQMLGYTLKELLNKDYVSTITLIDKSGNPVKPEDRPMFKTIRKHTKNTPLEAHMSYSFRRKDGTTFPIASTVTPVIYNDNLLGAIAIFHDITKERDIDRMKTEFISLASHQLRTPLSSLKWYTEMLLAGDVGKLTEPQQEFVTNINSSAERMISLVNSLLNISRIESGRIIIEPKLTNIQKLIDEVLKEVQVKYVNKKQILSIKIDQQVPEVTLDPKLIHQVYLNLLTNAMKYTPDNGQITISLTLNGKDLLTQITDTGYGIPKNQQGKIFQKFFRAENVSKFETDGTGLGLYLVKSIVEASEGRIWFTSEEGKGTTFFFTLPLNGPQAKKGEVTLEV